MRGNENGKRKRRCKKGEDRISQLPDDILISIISRLTSREATATSILSVRWRSLCAYATRIDFPRLASTEKRLQSNTVDHVLDSHRGCKVKEFRVNTFGWEGAGNLRKWLEFALAKEVEIIDLQLLGRYDDHLSLKDTMLNTGELSRCLKQLTLRSIDVDDRELVLLLRNLPLLEHLSVAFTRSLRNPSIVGHSTCKLKHLYVSGAEDLESIEIDGLMNLTSLEYYGLPITRSLLLNNVPKLIEFSTIDHHSLTAVDIFTKTRPSIRDQLQRLEIFWEFGNTWAYAGLLVQFIGVRNLKLKLKFSNDVAISISGLLNLIQACPSLEKLEIKISWLWWPKSKVKANQDKEIHWHRLPELKLSPNLKKVKLSDFVGSSSELELALSIMKNVEALEELSVEACGESKKIRALATLRARQHFTPTMLPYPFTLLVI